MKCCSVSITLLHVLTAVSAVMMIAASSYALDTEHWMKNTSLQTKDHDVSDAADAEIYSACDATFIKDLRFQGAEAYQGLKQECIKFSLDGHSKTSCADRELKQTLS